MSDRRSPKKTAAKIAKSVDDICKSGRIIELTEQYVSFCLSEEKQRLPNISGFFRWLKMPASARDHFINEHRDDYRTVKMIFEDETLNSPLPPSIVSAYIRQYFDGDDAGETPVGGGITLTFEHDICRDGE